MKVFTTRVYSYDENTNEVTEYSGDYIYALDEDDARNILDSTGRGYMVIHGELTALFDVEHLDLYEILENSNISSNNYEPIFSICLN